MKKIIFGALYILIAAYAVFSNDTTTVATDDYDRQKLSLKVKSGFDRRFDGPVKEFYFFKGDTPITQKEFEFIVKDNMIRDNKKKLKTAEDVGFGTAIALGGLATAFLVPSIIFVAGQLNYYKTYSTAYGYDSWLDYYKSNYDYVILPGLINIALTFALSLTVVIDLAVTFSLINKYKYNEMMYRDVIDRYNRNLKKKYSIVPDISFVNTGSDHEALVLGVRVKL